MTVTLCPFTVKWSLWYSSSQYLKFWNSLGIMAKLINHPSQDVVFIYSKQQCGADECWVSKSSHVLAVPHSLHSPAMCTGVGCAPQTNKSSFFTWSKSKKDCVCNWTNTLSAGLGKRHVHSSWGRLSPCPGHTWLSPVLEHWQGFIVMLTKHKTKASLDTPVYQFVLFFWLSKHLHQG